MSYKWQDDYVNDGGHLKDGWYYIKLGCLFGDYTKDFSEALPPTRCVYVYNSYWYVKDIRNQHFFISPDMVESPAFTIGKEYEFSKDGKCWETDIYNCYDYYLDDGNHITKDNRGYDHCRPIQKKGSKLILEGKEIILSEDTLNSIKEALKDD